MSDIAAKRLALLLRGWSDGRGPLYSKLTRRLAELIDTGVVTDGDRLPSERRLAERLLVSRGTVVRAYDDLAGTGRVVRRPGSGTRVSGSPMSGSSRSAPGTDALISPSTAVDFRIGRPRLLSLVRHLIDGTSLDEVDVDDPQAHDPAGHPALREAVAERMTLDGLDTSPEEILITCGGQHGATLLVMHLLRAGDRVAVEQTTWPGFPDTIDHFGGRVHRVPIGHDGVDLVEFRAAIERLSISFAALNPHHHNPTGTRLPDRRRSELAALTTEARVPLIEDRVLARLAFDHRVPPPMAAEPVARANPELHVVLDSLDKCAWPALRIGWIRATPSTIQRLRSLRAMTDAQPALQPQLAALAILGELDHVVADRRAELRRHRDVVLDLLPAAIPGASWRQPAGGLAVWVRLPTGCGRDFAQHAASCGVRIASGSDFGAPDHDPHIRVTYTLAPTELAVGIRRIARAWETFERASARRSPSGGPSEVHG